MKPTNFSKGLTDFLTKYLPGDRAISHNTISSYKFTFVLFLTFMEEERKLKPDKLQLKYITKDCIVDFLNWLQTTRKSSDASRNVRLAGVHSFFRFLQYEFPEYLNQCQQILSIKFKKTEKTTIDYLTIEGIRLLLRQPDIKSKKGRRDLAMLALMYDSGARVSEIVNLTPSMIRLNEPYTVKLIGKGNKARIIPLMEQEIVHLKRYMANNKLLEPENNLHPLFFNSRKEKLTRAGVNYVLQGYANIARKKNPTLIPIRVSPHVIRHSKAMHLLQAGVHLVYIRDILGHESVVTTEIYARVDSKQKREAIEKAYTDVVKKEMPRWQEDKNLLNWLRNFK